MNFNKEFGYPFPSLGQGYILNKYHRYRILRVNAKCNRTLTLWEIRPLIDIQLSNICKKCLSTFSAEEIEDLKHWLILKKLGVSV